MLNVLVCDRIFLSCSAQVRRRHRHMYDIVRNPCLHRTYHVPIRESRNTLYEPGPAGSSSMNHLPSSLMLQAGGSKVKTHCGCHPRAPSSLLDCCGRELTRIAPPSKGISVLRRSMTVHFFTDCGVDTRLASPLITLWGGACHGTTPQDRTISDYRTKQEDRTRPEGCTKAEDRRERLETRNQRTAQKPEGRPNKQDRITSDDLKRSPGCTVLEDRTESEDRIILRDGTTRRVDSFVDGHGR